MRAFVVDKISERVTDGVAVGAISSPLWLNVADFFSALLPIMGCLWIGIQIWYHFRKKDDKK